MNRQISVLFPFLVALAALTMSGAARADDAVAQHLFGGPVGDGKFSACFVRSYDAGHLRRHPLQRITGMKLLVSGEKSVEDGEVSYTFQMAARMRGRERGSYETAGGCGHAHPAEDGGVARLECGVDCDGGGITVEVPSREKSVIVKFDRVSVWRSGKSDESDEEGRHALQAGADDLLFRLERASLKDCKSLIAEPDEVALK